MGRFNRIRFVLRNFIINILKWIIIFIIASMLKIDVVELIVLLITATIDIFLLLVLRNKLLKTIVNLSSYWVLGPIVQLGLIENFSMVNVIKVAFCFLIIVITQILEYYTYKDLVVE